MMTSTCDGERVPPGGPAFVDSDYSIGRTHSGRIVITLYSGATREVVVHLCFGNQSSLLFLVSVRQSFSMQYLSAMELLRV